MFEFINVYITPLDLKSCLVAILCGFLIGVDRQVKGKPAGIRTSILVCLGAYTFVVIAGSFENEASPSRVIGQVVSGIGFLGAGLILAKDGLIHGVTSAAIIWLLAGIGCLIGIGKSESALFLTLLALFILVGINLLEKVFEKLKQGFHK
ncbi:MgtC/SapB family protein [Putridiphycobacter roseus]|uniref:MgtC/SapB family protein n=1 Tax=Putridiphycobacter roseus TaxID=2219161 RepID=A0A2W1MZZ9_9FLAO|nr:MgtC/SapB family protein [Putridiphycobacter roseus]PZE17819.1 MgtC/SapB family protein [Putridiphycobacter roseus]